MGLHSRPLLASVGPCWPMLAPFEPCCPCFPLVCLLSPFVPFCPLMSTFVSFCHLLFPFVPSSPLLVYYGPFWSPMPLFENNMPQLNVCSYAQILCLFMQRCSLRSEIILTLLNGGINVQKLTSEHFVLEFMIIWEDLGWIPRSIFSPI